MLPPVTGIDSPGGDVLNHVWALKERSGQAFHEAVSAVKGFLERGDPIYPPFYPDYIYQRDRKPISNNPGTNQTFVGTLLPAEAVAATILFEESLILTRAGFKGFGNEIHVALGLEDIGDDVIMVIDGIAMFGNWLDKVAWVREQLFLDEPKPKRKLNDCSIEKEYILIFEETLKRDGMNIGVNTVNAIVERINRQMNMPRRLDILEKDSRTSNPQLSSIDINSPTLDEGVNYWTLGAKMAADLFLEASELASKQFPNNG